MNYSCQDITETVTWFEPLGSGKYGYLCKAPVEDIINYMKEEYQETHKDHPNYPYKSDQDALDDFITINWATLVNSHD
jgi:hypothetical protein